jgi:hypothetical protein
MYAFGVYGTCDRAQLPGLADAAKRLHRAKCRLESAGNWFGISPEAGNQELIRLTAAVNALFSHRPAPRNGRKASDLSRGSLTPEMKDLADDYTAWKAERDQLKSTLDERHSEFTAALNVVNLAADMAT